jgi:hypothetical protein
MSASGPKQTWAGALHMSAFGGKADIKMQFATFSVNADTAPESAVISSSQSTIMQRR